MTNYVHSTNLTTAANIRTLADGDNVYVGQGASLATTGGNAYGFLGTSGHHLTLAGDISSNYITIYLTSSAGPNQVTVTDGGSIMSAFYAYYDFGTGSRLMNAGTVSGSNYGSIQIGTNSQVLNTGLLHSNGVAVYFGTATGTNTVVNGGDIVSALTAISGSSAVDKVYNTGFISGDVFLAGGADLLDSRGGLLQGDVDLGSGNDTAYGGDGSDSINGGADLDRLRGKLGDDRLDGGLAKDMLTGGADEDEFYFSTALGGGNVDTITDFHHGEDTILLSATIFSALGTSVSKSEFYIPQFGGHSAAKASHHIIYDKNKGTLWYDDDGHGGNAAVKFAVLEDRPQNLNYHDFAIV